MFYNESSSGIETLDAMINDRKCLQVLFSVKF